MVLALEIGLFIYGIITIVRGKVTLASNRSVLGVPARIIGVIALLTVPIIMAIAFGVGILIAISNPQSDLDRMKWVFVVLEIGLLILSCVIMMLIARAYSQSDPGVAAWRQYEWEARQMAAPPPGYGQQPYTLEPPPPVLPMALEYPPVRCPSCNSMLKVGPEWAGKQIRCSKCQTILTAPAAPRSNDAISERPPR